MNYWKLIFVLCFFLLNTKFIQSRSPIYADSLINVLETTRYDTIKVIVCNRLYLYFQYKDTLNAKKYIEQSIKIALKADYKTGLGQAYTYYGYFNENKGDYAEALKCYQNALSVYTKLMGLNNKSFNEIGEKGVAESYTNIGIVYDDQGNYKLSLENYMNALKIWDKLDDVTGKASCYLNIGIIQLNQGNYEKAIEYYNLSLENYKKLLESKEKSVILQGKNGIALCYNNIGNSYFSMKKYEDALSFVNKSSEIYTELGNIYGLSQNYNNIGNYYYKQGDYYNALEYYRKTLNLSEQLGNKFGMSIAYSNIAMSNIKLKKFNEAIVNSEKSLNLGKETGSLQREKYAYDHLSLAYEGLKDFKKAFEYQKLFKLLNDSIYNEETSHQLKEIEAKYQSEKKQLQIDNLIKDQAIKDSEIKFQKEAVQKQRVIIYSFILGFLIILFFSIMLFRLYSAKKKANVQLEHQNKEIQQKNEEISSQRDEIETQRDIVTKQKDHIEEIHNELKDSIHYAKRIQQALLPDLSSVIPNPVFRDEESIKPGIDSSLALGMTSGIDYFIFFRPKDVVSGDFYWVTNLNETLIIAVADCTGHGVPGAFMSMLGISFLNEIVRKKEVTRANHVLYELRKSIIEALKQTGESGTQKDGMDISLIAINTTPQAQTSEGSEAQTSEGFKPSEVLRAYAAQWAGANNPLWVIRPKSQVQRPKSQENLDTTWNLEFETCFLEFKGDKMPIAIYERMEEFTNHELQLFPGDIIYLKSDGYEDQFGGSKSASGGKKFLSKNLKQLLIDNCRLNMNEQKEMLEKTLVNWIGDGEQIDDITLMGVRI